MSQTQPKQYIVRRMTHDGDKGGPDTYHYVMVTNPKADDLIYHGKFQAKQIVKEDNGPLGTTYETVYIPLDESKLTSEPFSELPATGDVVEF